MAQPPKPLPQAADAQAANDKVRRDGLFAGIVGEVQINENQLRRRQALIKRIEEALSSKYMLKAKIKDAAKRAEKATEIAEKLLSKKFFPNHGQFINAETAEKDLELSIETLDRTDDLWKMIWEYYLRAELQMNIPPAPDTIKIKLFESSAESIITPEAVKQSA